VYIGLVYFILNIYFFLKTIVVFNKKLLVLVSLTCAILHRQTLKRMILNIYHYKKSCILPGNNARGKNPCQICQELCQGKLLANLPGATPRKSHGKMCEDIWNSNEKEKILGWSEKQGGTTVCQGLCHQKPLANYKGWKFVSKACKGYSSRAGNNYVAVCQGQDPGKILVYNCSVNLHFNHNTYKKKFSSSSHTTFFFTYNINHSTTLHKTLSSSTTLISFTLVNYYSLFLCFYFIFLYWHIFLCCCI